MERNAAIRRRSTVSGAVTRLRSGGGRRLKADTDAGGVRCTARSCPRQWNTRAGAMQRQKKLSQSHSWHLRGEHVAVKTASEKCVRQGGEGRGPGEGRSSIRKPQGRHHEPRSDGRSLRRVLWLRTGLHPHDHPAWPLAVGRRMRRWRRGQCAGHGKSQRTYAL